MSRTLRPIVAFLLVVSGMPAAAHAVTADEVVQRHLAAHGGVDAWMGLDSMVIRGTQIAFSEEAPYVVRRERPNRIRIERNILGEDVVVASDGETLWWVEPTLGISWPRPITSPDAAIIAREAIFESPMVGYASKGTRVELGGKEDLDGIEVYRLDLTLADGWQESWYLDTSSFLEVAVKSKASDFGREMDLWTWYDDFREVDGLVLPFRQELEYGTRHVVYEVEEVETNAALDTALFRMPPPVGMEPLLPMVGEWDVKMEARRSERSPWEESTTTSTIEALMRGEMLQERFVYDDRGVDVTIIASMSYDRFEEVYRFTALDDATAQLIVLEGMLEEGVLTATNLESGTVRTSGDIVIHERLVIHDITPDGFTVDHDNSTDAGTTWTTTLRLTYTPR